MNSALQRQGASVPTCAVVLMAALLLTGCEPMTYAPEPETVSAVAGELTYFRDDRTGLCFAAISSVSYSSYKVLSIANVPCDAAGLTTAPAETGAVGNREAIEPKPLAASGEE